MPYKLRLAYKCRKACAAIFIIYNEAPVFSQPLLGNAERGGEPKA